MCASGFLPQVCGRPPPLGRCAMCAMCAMRTYADDACCAMCATCQLLPAQGVRHVSHCAWLGNQRPGCCPPGAHRLSARVSLGRGPAMAVWCHICMLDARQYGTLKLVLEDVARVRAAFDGSVVIFLFNFVGQPVAIWMRVLQRAFRDAPNVVHYQCPEGQCIVCLGQCHAGVTMLHAQCIQSPPDCGVTTYVSPMIYFEVLFQSQKSGGNTVAVLWVPGLVCTHGYHLPEKAYRSVLGFVKAATAFQRALSLSSPEQEVEADADLKKACQILQDHLSAIMVIVHESSDHFSDQYPILHWNMSGKMHAVLGTVRERKFVDIMENQKVCTLPACFRVKAMKKAYFVPHHSLGFWEPLFEKESGPQSESAATCPADSQSRVIAPGTEDVGNDAGQTSARADNELRDPECMICLSRPPTFVYEKCGHLGVCGPCRKWMCVAQYNKRKTTGRLAPREVRMDKAAQARVPCPYCRELTTMVYKDKFRGSMYHA